MLRLVTLLLCMGYWIMPVEAITQYALVIGIDEYRYADGVTLKNLQGAVNDARLIAQALRKRQVQLPDSRVLLNQQATRKQFLKAWHSMLAQAKKGDTLILTYSGHGMQVDDIAPLDEKDHKDEALVMYDFQPYSPRRGGLLLDDELFGLFQIARNYNIVVVMDACHSAGLVRSVQRPSGRARVVTRVATTKLPNVLHAELPLPTFADAVSLPHLTLISAVNQENLVVHEIKIFDQVHGALSWFFAQAIQGKADGDKDDLIDRKELFRFLWQKIRQFTHNHQKPQLIPTEDNTPLLLLNQEHIAKPEDAFDDVPASPPRNNIVQIQLDKVLAPARLQHVEWVQESGYDLRLVGNTANITVLNRNGDYLTTFPLNVDNAVWQRLIDKQLLLKRLTAKVNLRYPPLQIQLQEGDRVHRQGTILHFNIVYPRSDLPSLTLFNLSSQGEVQFLYPLTEYGDTPTVRYPYTLPPIQVTPPFGGEDLVAVACQQVPTQLHSLLQHGRLDNTDAWLTALATANCQTSQYAFFSRP